MTTSKTTASSNLLSTRKYPSLTAYLGRLVYAPKLSYAVSLSAGLINGKTITDITVPKELISKPDMVLDVVTKVVAYIEKDTKPAKPKKKAAKKPAKKVVSKK